MESAFEILKNQNLSSQELLDEIIIIIENEVEKSEENGLKLAKIIYENSHMKLFLDNRYFNKLTAENNKIRKFYSKFIMNNIVSSQFIFDQVQSMDKKFIIKKSPLYGLENGMRNRTKKESKFSSIFRAISSVSVPIYDDVPNELKNFHPNQKEWTSEDIFILISNIPKILSIHRWGWNNKEVIFF